MNMKEKLDEIRRKLSGEENAFDKIRRVPWKRVLPYGMMAAAFVYYEICLRAFGGTKVYLFGAE